MRRFTLVLLAYMLTVDCGKEETSCALIAHNTSVQVPDCPRNKDQYEKRKQLKGCENLTIWCSEATLYHCVPSPHMNATIETCAPQSHIVGARCAEINKGERPIQGSKHQRGKCLECPQFYLSTQAYKYPSCYDAVERKKSSEGGGGDKEGVDKKGGGDEERGVDERGEGDEERKREEGEGDKEGGGGGGGGGEDVTTTNYLHILWIALPLAVVVVVVVVGIAMFIRKKKMKAKWNVQTKDEEAGLTDPLVHVSCNDKIVETPNGHSRSASPEDCPLENSVQPEQDEGDQARVIKPQVHHSFNDEMEGIPNGHTASPEDCQLENSVQTEQVEGCNEQKRVVNVAHDDENAGAYDADKTYDDEDDQARLIQPLVHHSCNDEIEGILNGHSASPVDCQLENNVQPEQDEEKSEQMHSLGKLKPQLKRRRRRIMSESDAESYESRHNDTGGRISLIDIQENVASKTKDEGRLTGTVLFLLPIEETKHGEERKKDVVLKGRRRRRCKSESDAQNMEPECVNSDAFPNIRGTIQLKAWKTDFERRPFQ